MNMEELKKMNDADLQKELAEKRDALRKLTFGTAGSAMRDAHAKRNTRNAIARILTEQNRRAGDVKKETNNA